MSDDLLKLFHPDTDVEYTYFDADPDGDVDRAGDGLYFQLSGEDDWSGPWHSEEEARNEAIDALAMREHRDIVVMLTQAEFKAISPVSRNSELYSKETEDGAYHIELRDADIAVYKSTGSERAELRTIPDIDSDYIGHIRRNIVTAIQIAAEHENEHGSRSTSGVTL